MQLANLVLSPCEKVSNAYAIEGIGTRCMRDEAVTERSQRGMVE